MKVAVAEHRDYAVQFSFLPPPEGLKIYITRWAMFQGLASTPLFNQRWDNNFPQEYVSTFLMSNIQYIGPCVAILRRHVDIAIDYFRPNINGFTSDFIKETMYHELSHASHYSQVGWGWYSTFVAAELHEIIAHPGQTDPFNPYGIGTTSYSPIIALGEGWAFHMGHFLSDQQYGLQSSQVNDQGIGYTNNNPIAGLSSHLNLLENFVPTLQTDPFHWIPNGLMLDLMDNTAEPTQTFVNDQVSGFTIQQLYLALQADVNTVPQYRARLIQQNPGTPTNAIIDLFASYNY